MSACPRIPTTRYRAAHDSTTVCPGCRTELPFHASFCVECGLSMLDVTSEGTVIAPAPTDPATRPMQIVEDVTSEAIELGEEEEVEIDIDALVAEILDDLDQDPDSKLTRRFERVPQVPGLEDPGPGEGLEEPDPSATLTTMRPDIADEIEIEVELSDNEIELFFEDISASRLDRGPLTPSSQWPAPAPGSTVVGPTPGRR